MSILRILQILIIVSDLKQNSDQIHQRNVVPDISSLSEMEYVEFELHACMSLTARRRRPPVLLFTIWMYSCSVGHMRLSRQKRSIP